MSLTREAVIKIPAFKPGDTKLVGYDISFTVNQLIEPINDPGWFLLNGAIISQATYPILFARFGSSFNTGGEGVGNFRLPDFTDGTIPIPKGLANFTTFGGAGGELNHTLTSGELATHNHADTFSINVSGHGHGVSGSAASADNTHYHLYTYGATGSVGGSTGSIGDAVFTGITTTSTNSSSHGHTAYPTLSTDGSGNANLSGSISATSAGSAHNNVQPYLVVGGWLVKYG